MLTGLIKIIESQDSAEVSDIFGDKSDVSIK